MILFFAALCWIAGFTRTVETADISLFLNGYQQKYPEEFYYLTLQKCNSTSEWSIHGLWPNYGNGSYPEYCEIGVHYDPAVISDTTLHSMESDWYTCKTDNTNEEFWDHEISKHYTCVFSEEWTQEDYFANGIDLYWDSISSKAVYDHCHGENECMIPWDTTLTYMLWDLNQ